MRRVDILNQAEELFLTLGFKSVTMDDIANALGMSKKTIYKHFTNKTELVEEVTTCIQEKIFAATEQIRANSKNPIEELYETKMFLMTFLKEEKTSPQYQLQKYYPHIYKQKILAQFEKWHESLKKSLEKGKKNGLFRADIDSMFIARMYFNGMTGIRDERIFPRNIYSINILMENYLEYHLRAIVSVKGLAVLNNYLKKTKP